MRPFLFTAPSSSGACYSSEISRVVLYERHVCITRFKQTLQRHEGGFASGICQIHCFQNSLAWDVYSKSWPEVTLAIMAGRPLAKLQQLSDFLYPTAKPFPSPRELVVQNTFLVHITLSVPGTWLPWCQNSNVGQGLDSLQPARLMIQSPGLCGSAGVSLEQLECGVSQQT